MIKKDYYPLADHYIGDPRFNMTSSKYIHRYHDLRAIPTGEKRPPKKGEWYLSGAIIEAYQASNDLLSSHYIARIVLTKKVTTIVEEEVLEDQGDRRYE